MIRIRKKIIGQVDKVSMPQFGLGNVLAKVDTGAYYCRMHCDTAQKGTDGKVLFTINGKEFTADMYKPGMVVRTKGITGHEKLEYAIKSDIILGDNQYSADIVLSNRSDRNYRLLIGRKFLIDHSLLVDVRRGIENDIEYNKEGK